MSEKEMRRTLRHHAARLRKEHRAVSPVVATLVLILVAVAAAAALYLWLVAWQGQVTSGIGQPNAQTTMNIGGSTTMFHLDQNAIAWFEANNSNVKIANNQGGSGSGILALCQGHVDISASSRPITSGDLAACPTLAGAVSTVVGYDAVIPIVAIANTHTLASVSGQSLNIAYFVNGGQPTAGAGYPTSNKPTTTTCAPTTKLTPACWGIKTPTGSLSGLTIANNLAWQDFPSFACFDAAVPVANIDVNGFLTGAYVSPCAWTYAADANKAHDIHIFNRFDNGGTAEAFDNNVLGIKCGTDQQLASCGFTVTNNPVTPVAGSLNGYTGNTALINKIATDADGLGYTSWGQALASTGQGGGAGLVTNNIGLMGTGQTGGAGNVVVPSLSTIKVGIAAGYGNQVAGGYAGWRPLQYNTMGPATGEAQRFIQFVTQPGTENTLDALDFFISTYA